MHMYVSHARPAHKQQQQANDPSQNTECICSHIKALLSQDIIKSQDNTVSFNDGQVIF